MSNPLRRGESPRATSPRLDQTARGLDPRYALSRPGTAGILTNAPRYTYPAIAPGTALPGLHNVPQSSPASTTQTPTRALGMQSILNPAEAPRSLQRLPGAIDPHTETLPPALSSPRSRKRAVPGSPSRDQGHPSQSVGGRRVLTPKSPGLRSASTGARRTPTYHGPAAPLQSFLGPEPRIYTAEPGSADIPMLPNIGPAGRVALPAIQTADPLPPQPRFFPGPQAIGYGPPPARSDSPSTSHTSQSRSEQTSPAYRYRTVPPRQHEDMSRMRGMQGASEIAIEGHGGAETYQSGQPAYQMTLETDQGPMVVPVELDLQQASKVADEKRKRNAGASVRFRARRKEKEKESSQKISDLQQELRDLREDREFYRNERNIIRDFAMGRLGASQLPPRPASPRTRRPPGRSSDSSQLIEESGRSRSDSAPAAQRRRTGDYPPSFTPAMQSPSQPFPSAYSSRPPPGLPLPPPQPPPSLAPTQAGPYASPRQLPPGPPPLSSRSQSYDPYHKEPYDRSWNPGR